MPEKIQDRNVLFESTLQYGGEDASSYYADARRELYKYAADGQDIWTEIAKNIMLEGSGRLVDVGTGSGTVIRKLLEMGYQGPIVGVDIKSEHFLPIQDVLSITEPDADVEFLVGSATSLPFEDNSADALVAAFLIYHLPRNEQRLALAEFSRVLKPGGKLIVSSRDTDNQERLWRLAGYTADRLGAPRPRSFYSNCDLARTEELLVERFALDDQQKFVQETELRIPPEGWQEYMLALFSLRNTMSSPESTQPLPTWSSVSKIVDSDILGLFQQEIRGIPGIPGKGYFSDLAKQGFFVCENTK